MGPRTFPGFTLIRVRDYPTRLDELTAGLPEAA
jgi:hypothetical protein